MSYTYLTKLVLLIALLLFYFGAFAQNYNSLEEFETALQNIKTEIKASKNYDNGILFLTDTLLPQAIEKFGESHPLIANIYYRRGFFHYKKGEKPTASAEFQKTLTIREKTLTSCDPAISKMYHILGQCYSEIEAIDTYKKAIQRRKNCNSPKLWNSHYELAFLYEDIGELLLAEEHSTRAINCAEKYDNTILIADCYLGRAGIRCNRKANSEAEEDLIIAKNIYQQEEIEIPIEWYIIRGDLYDNLKSYPEALVNYKKAEDDCPTEGKENVLLLINILNNKSITHRHLKEYNEAILILNKALDLAKEAYDNASTHPEYAAMYNNLSECYQDQGLYEKALEYADLALQQIEDSSSRKKTATARSTEAELLVILNTQIKLYTKQYEEKKQPKYIKKAVELSQKAIHLIDDIRKNHQKEASKLFWRDSTHIIYQYAVKTAYLADDKELGLHFCTKSKAALLTDALQQNTCPDNLYLGAKLTQYLEKDNAIISYFIGIEYLYVFYIEKDNFKSKRWLIPDDFEETVQAFYRIISDRTLQESRSAFSTFKKQGHALYQQLIEPLELPLKNLDDDNYSKLTIIPDGVLHYIPFEALVVSSPKQAPVYFLQHKVIKYEHSAATLWCHKDHIPSSPPKGSILAPQRFSHSNLGTLQYQAEEKSNISKSLACAIFPSDISIETFKEKANNYTILHFSTHASDGYPAKNEAPYIAFSHEKLYLSDIYTLNLSADLVVLSACSTAAGVFKTGEGVMSISRGFSYVGVPSQLTTLWKVNEKETAYIIGLFYDNLFNKKLPKDEALHYAKLGYLRTINPEREIPYFWAAYIFMGNNQAFK